MLTKFYNIWQKFSSRKFATYFDIYVMLFTTPSVVTLPQENSTIQLCLTCESVPLTAAIMLMITRIPADADKPARRLRNVCTVYVRAVGL